MDDIRIPNTRELDDFVWNRSCGVHEGVEALLDTLLGEDRGRDLDQLVVANGKSGRLGIENDHVLLDDAEHALPRALRKRLVLLYHESRSAREHCRFHRHGTDEL